MSKYLTPKDVAAELQICEDKARREMRRMRHINIGGEKRETLRTTKEWLDAYMLAKSEAPAPKPAGKRERANPKTANTAQRAIAYR